MTGFVHRLAKSIMAFFRMDSRHLPISLVVILILQFFASLISQAQIPIAIPREGFPYCEPFSGTNNIDDFRNTIINGNIRNNVTGATGSYVPTATGTSLQLTPNEEWHNGYVIIDIPFSSQFGVKTSFEYYTYGGDDNAADGLSFFMFDADEPVNIGWLGGSLGYAPYVNADGSVDPGKNGIKGGYLGIGFDEWGNFAVGSTGKNITDWEDRVPNSITIRRPEDFGYEFHERFVTTEEVITPVLFGPSYTFTPPFSSDQWFEIDDDGLNRTDDCNTPGYRKVFIELIPNDPPTVGYSIKIDMLVNSNGFSGPKHISFPLVPYVYEAPQRLKIGFAGATGSYTNYHEIANVSVNVSNLENVNEPQVIDQLAKVCEGSGDVEMEFKVDLSTSQSFVTCIQLFSIFENPPPTDNSLPDTNYNFCGLDGSLCKSKCDVRYYEAEAYDLNGDFAGTVYAELVDLDTDNFDQLKDIVNVRFEPISGFTGEASVNYHITDNFGLTSDLAKLTFVVNPPPIKLQADDQIPIENPSCDGQSDGRIYNIKVGDLVADFEYEWLLDNVSIGKIGSFSLENGVATFELNGINLGNYTLKVWNPVDDPNGPCYVFIDIPINQENGTPVDLDIPDQTICEGEDVSFLPLIDPANNPSGATPNFLWYQNADRSGGALVNNTTVTIAGNPVNISISSTGELTLAGLKNKAGTPPYEFYVEAASQSQSGGNFCPYLGQVLTVATVTVNPPLDFTASVTNDDWCLAYIGEIVGSVSGATDITYTLLNELDEVLGTNNTGVFSALPSGDYKIYGTSASLGCSSPVEEVRVEGPAEGLVITKGAVENSYCSLPNGTISFELSGGNVPYQSIQVNGTSIPFDPSGAYTITGLSAAQYSIDIVDAKGCTTSQTVEVLGDPPSNFTTIGSEVCEGQEASASIDVMDSSSGLPTFNWYKDDGSGGYTLIPNELIEGNITYYVSPLKELFVTGLPASEEPYIFYLRVTGDRICDQGYIPTEIKVTPGPEMDAPSTTDACFGESTGAIQAQIPGNNFSDFEFSISGDNGVLIDFSKNGGLFENLPAGTYELSIRSALGCVTTLEDVKIMQPDAPITINNPSIERASCDLSNGLIKDLVISGGWGNYSVEWRKGAIDGAVIPGDATSAIDLLPDTYFLIVTDDKGCQETFDFLIEESSDPVYSLVPTINSCLGEAVIIKPIHIAPDPSLPPTAYTEVIWYKESGQVGQISNGPDATQPEVTYTIDDTDWLNPSLVVEGLPAGDHDYYFYVVCTGQELKANLTVFDIPEVTVSTTPVSCFGSDDGKVILVNGMSPLYTYSLDGGSPVTQEELENLNLLAGDYDLEVLTPAGCPQASSFTVEGPDAALEMTPLIGIDPGCGAPNGKLRTTISGGWAPYTVTVLNPTNPVNSFTTSDTDIQVDGLVSGFYSIQVTDSQNCLISSSTIELVDGPTQIEVEEQSICEGQAVEFTPIIDPQSSTASFIWYFDAGTTQVINSSSAPAADGNIYEINSSTGALTVTGLPTKSTAYQYYVVAQGSEVCPGSVGTASVMVYDTPTASPNITNEVCFGEGGTIEIIVSGGSGEYTFSIDGAPEQESNIFQNVPVGIHEVFINTPETCEVLLSNIEVTGPQSPLEIEISDVVNPTCSLSNGEITLQASGGYPIYSIEIIKDGVSQGSSSTDQNGELVISNIGQGEYAFSVTDAGGCSINLNEPLDLVEVPTVIEVEDQQICEGEDVSLSPEIPATLSGEKYTWYFDQALTTPLTSGTSNGVTYTIDNSGNLSISGLLAPSSPYSYYVMVEGPGICGVVPKEVKVVVSAYQNLRVSNPSIVCDPEGTVDLTDFIEGYNPEINDYNIISPFGNALLGSELKAVNESGNYEVSVSSKGTDCWTAPKRILVRIAEELLQSNFEYHADQGGGIIVSNEDIQIQENVDFEDLSQGNVLIWDWNFGDGSSSNEQNPRHVFQDKGTYTVTLMTTDTIGCQSTYSITVEVKDDYLLMMPNAFTPDGNKNQFYKPAHRGIASIDFYVFNTWGELIYNSNSLEDQGWDGNVNGKKAPNGNYVYKVKYQTRSGNEFDESGVFILIR